MSSPQLPTRPALAHRRSTVRFADDVPSRAESTSTVDDNDHDTSVTEPVTVPAPNPYIPQTPTSTPTSTLAQSSPAPDNAQQPASLSFGAQTKLAFKSVTTHPLSHFGKGRERRARRERQEPLGPSTLRRTISITDVERADGEAPAGFVDRIRAWIRRLARDPTPFMNDATSAAGSEDAQQTHVNPNELTDDQINAYLFYEKSVEDNPDQRDAVMDDMVNHMTYAQRRRREKHHIVYCRQSKKHYRSFILTFARTLLVFGSPSHRIEAQLNSLGRVFQIDLQVEHTSSVISISFSKPDADEMADARTYMIKAPTGISLSRSHDAHLIYRQVLHDEMYASVGTRKLQKLLDAPPRYGFKTRLALSFLTSSLICGIAFGGSLNDMWVAGVLAMCARIVATLATRSEITANGTEIFVTIGVAFIGRALASHNDYWCFTSVTSASIISLLPGFVMLSGVLDMAGKNVTLGAPKVISAIMASLYLGFGLTFGSDVYLTFDANARAALAAAHPVLPPLVTGIYNSTSLLSGQFTFQGGDVVAPVNMIGTCYRDPSWMWYLQPLPGWSNWYLVPLFAFFASMNNQQHWYHRNMAIMVFNACVCFLITRFANMYWGLSNTPDYVALIGSFAVGVIGNTFSRRFGGTGFTAMLTAILLLVPSGLAAAGGLASNYNEGEDEYTQSLELARKMIEVIIGIMAGVWASAALVYAFGKRKQAALVTF